MVNKPCPVDREDRLIWHGCIRQTPDLPCLCGCPYSSVSGNCIYGINSDVLPYINYLEEQFAAKADSEVKEVKEDGPGR